MSTITSKKDYSKFFTELSMKRKPSAIRELQKFIFLPGMISLGGGSPHPETFPFAEFNIKFKDGTVVNINEKETAKVMQYNATNGLPELVKILNDIQTAEHNPPYKDFDIIVGGGSQDVLTKAFEMLLSRDSTLLLEAPTYVGSLAFLKALGCNFEELTCDKDGLIPENFERVLKNWDHNKKDFPKVLYTVPCGGNPTGASTTFERKKKIYEICSKYDILILEDDPYYYLQFNEKRTPSYISFDKEQRVLRFDSFSKILSSGMRVGWATGPKPLIERLTLHGQASSLHTSNISQTFVLKILEHWNGFEGFNNHCKEVTKFYEKRRDVFFKLCEKHLKGNEGGDVASYDLPTAGMFFWIKLLGVEDSMELIKSKAVEKKVLLVPGFEFFANPRVTSYCRSSFSIASEEEMELALKRLAEIVVEERKK
ncbi:hypothetical protein HDU92_006193 [Lobulomyces angularis]|nr:hypothetical protein HDU92_006193 [Lobulomyces angularis]